MRWNLISIAMCSCFLDFLSFLNISSHLSSQKMQVTVPRYCNPWNVGYEKPSSWETKLIVQSWQMAHRPLLTWSWCTYTWLRGGWVLWLKPNMYDNIYIYIKIQVYSCRLDLRKYDDSISIYVYTYILCLWIHVTYKGMYMRVYRGLWNANEFAETVYQHNDVCVYIYVRCKTPLINLGRCNEHCSVGPASLEIGQVHGGSLFVTDAGRVRTWGVEMWKVWKRLKE